MPLFWQTCPTTGLIPNQTTSSPTNNPPITGFPPVNFLDNLPGILDAPSAGGVMRFRAHVLVGDPVCVAAGDSGTRDLVFKVNVFGLPETKLGATFADNTATVTTQVPGTCKVADIQFTNSGIPSTFSLNGSGVGTWTYTATVTNLSSGGTAGTATNVPVQFEHHQSAFTETQGPLTCSPSALCPTSPGISSSNSSGFSFSTTIPSLP